VSWDVLGLDAIYTPRMVIDFSSATVPALDDPAALFAPSDRALQALLDDRLSEPSGFFTCAKRVVSAILNTGASLGVSPFVGDFLETPTPPSRPMFIGSMSSGLRITGIGKIVNTFTAKDGTEVILISDGYLVRQANARLCNPQRVLCKKRGIFGKFEGNEDDFSLLLDGAPPITVQYQKTSNLPVAEVLPGPQPEPKLNLAGVMSEENQNLTAGQKLLLEWHARFGHRNFAIIQRLMRFFPFTSQEFGAAAKCDIPRCFVCEFAKEKRRPKQSQRTTKVPERDGALKKEHLSPGTQVSCDHFESRLRGRTYDSYGKTTSNQYVRGCIFVDHGSGYVNVQNQLVFSALETIRAKQSFDQFALGNGVMSKTI
jgi:hypothetical protein